MLKQGKTNLIYVLIIIILAVIVGGSILVWTKRQEVPPAGLSKIEKIEKAEDEIADWKTYNNEEHRYEVKYPDDWVNFGEDSEGFNITSPIVEGRADNRVIVIVDKRENSESNEEYLDNMIEENTLPGYYELNRKKEIIVNGIKSYEIVWNELDSVTQKLEEGQLGIYIEAPIENKARFIVFFFQGKGSQYETNLQTFNQMLSAFRFLD